MARPVRVEVIAPTFEGMGLCGTCELVLGEAGVGGPPSERGLDEVPAEWRADWERLGEWVADLAARYAGRVTMRVIDPQSPQGLLRSLRHRIRRYPTWLVGGKARVVGWEREALERAIEQATEASGV